MAKLLVLTTCALLGLTSGASLKSTFMPSFSRAGKIVGGFQIDVVDVPYQVSLQRNNRHHCGGSIIDERWVLTAAHCTENTDAGIYSVRVGSSEHATGGQLVPVKAVHNHPDYDREVTEFDFCLLELGERLEFGHAVQPVDLVRDEPADESQSLVSGWGDTRSLEESTDILRGVLVPLVNREECAEAYQKLGMPVTESMICAGFAKEGGKDACQGDSGGPLVVDGQLAGVVSWGKGCAEPGYPGIYSNVAYVRDWIKKVAKV
ncbi:trypsin 2 [Culex quinquefasciatus]|uniref:trypsin n=1 Tax=Culex quinquefasciatus TaxID=7176 RepID=B0WE94_CULQU|nr:trypsin 2 [Culex quinquefasciatus]|eukprot:XP_001847028.1 trypsin 2 [Culex quinquefasciatus]